MWGTGATMRDQVDRGDAFGRAEIAHYVAGLSSDLARLAGQNRLEVLKHLLEMVQLEAENLNQRESG